MEWNLNKILAKVSPLILRALALKKLISLFPELLKEDGSIKTPTEYMGYEEDSLGFRMGSGEDYHYYHSIYSGKLKHKDLEGSNYLRFLEDGKIHTAMHLDINYNEN